MSQLDDDLKVEIRPEDGPVVHEYDGIQECDNHLPLWWLWTFYGAIIFGLAYWVHYHTLETGDTLSVSYQKERAAAQAAEAERLKAAGDVSEALLTTLSKDSATIAEGKQTFVQTCAACHGQAGEGKIGPNLTDKHWIRGGDPMSIYKVVKDGAVEKQMPAWGPVLGEERVRNVSAYLLTIKNTNAPGGKAPQGEVVN